MTWRPFAILTAALWLSACSNMVYSERPLFEPERAPVITFRAGFWAAPEPECAFDPAKPFGEWPECANGVEYDERGAAGERGKTVLASGKPIIVQASPSPDDEAPFLYSYWAIEPTARDESGRVTSFAAWAVQCGPPNAARPSRPPESASNITRRPLPGLLIRGDNCLASRPRAVRRAATASRKWWPASVVRWVRDKDGL
jgi:hypothetical protein